MAFKMDVKAESGINKYSKFYEDAVRIQKEILGPYHPEIASMLWNVGISQLKIGCIDEAMDSFMETLLIRRLILGNDHSDIAEILHKIGEIFELKGENHKALNFFTKHYVWKKRMRKRPLSMSLSPFKILLIFIIY